MEMHGLTNPKFISVYFIFSDLIKTTAMSHLKVINLLAPEFYI
jgi:hypothetical protein